MCPVQSGRSREGELDGSKDLKWTVSLNDRLDSRASEIERSYSISHIESKSPND